MSILMTFNGISALLKLEKLLQSRINIYFCLNFGCENFTFITCIRTLKYMLVYVEVIKLKKTNATFLKQAQNSIEYYCTRNSWNMAKVDVKHQSFNHSILGLIDYYCVQYIKKM